MQLLSCFIGFLQASPILGVLCYCATGLSGGLLSAWNPHKVRCRAFHNCARILLQASFRGLTYPLTILNIYGPYKNREPFWENALTSGFLSTPNLILGGDLNLTLHSSEVWGHKPSPDPLFGYFISLFDTLGLMDLAPCVQAQHGVMAVQDQKALAKD